MANQLDRSGNRAASRKNWRAYFSQGARPSHALRSDAKAPGAGGEGLTKQHIVVPRVPRSHSLGVRGRQNASWQVRASWPGRSSSDKFQNTPCSRNMPRKRPAPKGKRHEEGLHRHPGPPPRRRVTGKTKAATMRITSKTSFK